MRSRRTGMYGILAITAITAQNFLERNRESAGGIRHSSAERYPMRYSVFLEPIKEAEFQGYYYAHIPTLDLTTHGQGMERAFSAAQELVEAWIEEKRVHGEMVSIE
ncbi:MAG: type II toxin-antitoxin system HicB family antitoxin [Thermodesulfobacteriota bacterium]